MNKAPKEDPPLLARPETPDDFERFEAQAYEVRVYQSGFGERPSRPWSVSDNDSRLVSGDRPPISD